MKNTDAQFPQNIPVTDNKKCFRQEAFFKIIQLKG
jgi:hypothetical protein